MDQSVAQHKEHSGRYIRLPMALFCEERYKTLSALAKLAYALLLDRAALSKKNGDKWSDGQGNVFIYFPRQEMGKYLGCTAGNSTRIMQELEAHKLILRINQGLGKPSKVVILDDLLRSEFASSEGAKMRSLERAKNNTSNIYRTNKYRANQQRDHVMNMQRELDEDERRAIRRMLQEEV